MSGYLSLNAQETYARWSVVFVAIVIAILCLAGYVFAPKGDNQTYVPELSSSLTLFMTCCVPVLTLCILHFQN